jgi:hypothetical protein
MFTIWSGKEGRTVAERGSAARKAVADEQRGWHQRRHAPQRHHRGATAQAVHRLLEQERNVHVGELIKHARKKA